MTDKLFTLGPVEMFDYTKARTLGPLPYFRTEEFSKINLECAERLRRLAGAPEDSHVYLLTCSGTGAMEAVVGGCYNAIHDKLLVVNGGDFGRRFSDMVSWGHGITHRSIYIYFGKPLTEELLIGVPPIGSFIPGEPPIDRMDVKYQYSGKGYTGLLVNLHETTTGQLYDKDMIAEFCRKNNLYLTCDAIGSFLADPLDFEQDSIDALIISSQKALALPPGVAMVILSDRMYQKIDEQNFGAFSMYFDFLEAEKDAVRGQTPFTPAVGTILALRERLEHLENEGGAEASVARTKALAEDFRTRISGLVEKGLIELPSYPLSNACTPLIFPNGGAESVYRKLAEKGVFVNPNGGELADTVLRVGHLGNLTVDDNAMLAGLLYDIL